MTTQHPGFGFGLRTMTTPRVSQRSTSRSSSKLTALKSIKSRIDAVVAKNRRGTLVLRRRDPFPIAVTNLARRSVATSHRRFWNLLNRLTRYNRSRGIRFSRSAGYLRVLQQEFQKIYKVEVVDVEAAAAAAATPSPEQLRQQLAAAETQHISAEARIAAAESRLAECTQACGETQAALATAAQTEQETKAVYAAAAAAASAARKEHQAATAAAAQVTATLNAAKAAQSAAAAAVAKLTAQLAAATEASAEATQPKKAAVLIGINYTNTSSALGGCENDIYATRNVLINQYGYKSSDIRVLTESETRKPRYSEILSAISWLVQKNKEGFKELWFQYSGHGYYLKDGNSDEVDGRDECIITLDHRAITDDMLAARLANQISDNTKLTCIMDCCHSGTIFDLRYKYPGTSASQVQQQHSKTTNRNKQIMCISGCRDPQTSADAWLNNKWQGAMTKFFLQTLRENNYNMPVISLVTKMRQYLSASRFTQVPMLTTSQQIQNTTPF